MPMLVFHTPNVMSNRQQTELKQGIADIIGLIPGKAEKSLMIVINEGVTIFKAGEHLDEGVYADMKLFHHTTHAGKRAFTEAFFPVVERVLGIPAQYVQLTIREYDSWGAGGAYLD